MEGGGNTEPVIDLPVRYFNGYKIFGPPAVYAAARPEQSSEIIIKNARLVIFENKILPLILECQEVFKIKLKIRDALNQEIDPTENTICFVVFLTHDAREEGYRRLGNRELTMFCTSEDGSMRQESFSLKVFRAIDGYSFVLYKIPPTVSSSDLEAEVRKQMPRLASITIPKWIDREDDDYDHMGFAFVYFSSYSLANEHFRKLICKDIVLFNGELGVKVRWATPPHKSTLMLLLRDVPEHVENEKLLETLVRVVGDNVVYCSKMTEPGQFLVEVKDHIYTDMIKAYFEMPRFEGASIEVDIVPKSVNTKDLALQNESRSDVNGGRPGEDDDGGDFSRNDSEQNRCPENLYDSGESKVEAQGVLPNYGGVPVPIYMPTLQRPVFQTAANFTVDQRPLVYRFPVTTGWPHGSGTFMYPQYFPQPQVASMSYQAPQVDEGLGESFDQEASRSMMDDLNCSATNQPQTVEYLSLTGAGEPLVKQLLKGSPDLPIPIAYASNSVSINFPIESSSSPSAAVVLIPFIRKEVISQDK